jgi:hypothetical protein
MIYDAEMLEDWPPDEGNGRICDPCFYCAGDHADGDCPDWDGARSLTRAENEAKREPAAESVCRRCKRPTEYKAALCYDCEIALYGGA